jgi:hypothetical protein
VASAEVPDILTAVRDSMFLLGGQRKVPDIFTAVVIEIRKYDTSLLLVYLITKTKCTAYEEVLIF